MVDRLDSFSVIEAHINIRPRRARVIQVFLPPLDARICWPG
jgi:hypothetical protein